MGGTWLLLFLSSLLICFSSSFLFFLPFQKVISLTLLVTRVVGGFFNNLPTLKGASFTLFLPFSSLLSSSLLLFFDYFSVLLIMFAGIIQFYKMQAAASSENAEALINAGADLLFPYAYLESLSETGKSNRYLPPSIFSSYSSFANTLSLFISQRDLEGVGDAEE